MTGHYIINCYNNKYTIKNSLQKCYPQKKFKEEKKRLVGKKIMFKIKSMFDKI